MVATSLSGQQQEALRDAPYRVEQLSAINANQLEELLQRLSLL